MPVVSSLPHWDMSVVYPGLASQEFEQGCAGVVQDIDDLARLFDTHHVMEQPAAPLNDDTIRSFETVIERYNRVVEATVTLQTYILCIVSTNTQDSLAQAKLSEMQQPLVTLRQLGTRFTAWIGSFDVDDLIARSTIAREHAFVLRKARLQAAHLMTPPEEALASELNVSGGTAWAKLHSDVTSQMTVLLERDGEVQQLPMSMVRNMAYEGDREVRRKAYEAELAGWKQVT